MTNVLDREALSLLLSLELQGFTLNRPKQIGFLLDTLGLGSALGILHSMLLDLVDKSIRPGALGASRE